MPTAPFGGAIRPAAACGAAAACSKALVVGAPSISLRAAIPSPSN